MFSLMSGFQLGYTHFFFVMAILSTLVATMSAFCSLKALEKSSFSLYSTFTMLGGMALPFVAGLLFYDEALTIGKGICFLFITIALFFTVEPDEKKKLNLKAIFAIFGSSVLNRVANLWLLVSLTVLPASAQYPFITGGTMIASTVIAYITHQKPKKGKLFPLHCHLPVYWHWF